MITIFSGTNRKNSYTKMVALEYKRLLLGMNEEVQIAALDEIDVTQRNDDFVALENEWAKSDKYIMILPEYNGSFPGILKLMIDNSDVKKLWWDKKVLLTGVATGRAGNLRGMEHLTGSLLHMKCIVHPNRLPISLVNSIFDENGRIKSENSLAAINNQLLEFINF